MHKCLNIEVGGSILVSHAVKPHDTEPEAEEEEEAEEKEAEG